MVIFMDFFTMGTIDARSDIDKSGIDGESKTATIRVSADYLDLLNSISKITGLSRQAFMSRLIEVYAVDAIAEYVCGYRDYFGNDDISVSGLLSDDVPEKDKENFEKFLKEVEQNLLFRKLSSRGINAIPNDDDEKKSYFELSRNNNLIFTHGV